MKTIFIISILLLQIAHAQCEHDKSTFRCVKYIRNYDADTITVSIPNVHKFFGEKISVRLFGVDAPEVRTKDKCEKKLAREAKKYVASVLSKSKRIDLTDVKKDKYFRLLSDVIIDGQSLRSLLFKHNYAYPYYGKTKKKVNWCKPDQVKSLIQRDKGEI